MLPGDPALRELLRDAEWLPRVGGESGMAPRRLLIIPEELRTGLMPLARQGGLGQHRLTDDLDPEFWKSAGEVMMHLLDRPSPLSQVRNIGKALNSAVAAEVNDGVYVLLPDADRIDVPLVDDALQSTLPGSHAGWALVAAAARSIGTRAGKSLDDTGAGARDAVLDIARRLCGTILFSQQAAMLTTVARSHPAKESPSGRLFRRLVEAFATTRGFHDRVLPAITLPTQDGHWRDAREIARSTSGVARRHLLRSDLHGPLGLDRDEPVRYESPPKDHIDSSTAGVLQAYFTRWRGRLPDAAIGAFLSLLGNGKDNAILTLAEGWLGDVNVSGMRRELAGEARGERLGTVKVIVHGIIEPGRRVTIANLLGERVELEAGADDRTIFATEPGRESSELGDFWNLSLRDIQPEHRAPDFLLSLLEHTVERWATRGLRIDRQQARTWWFRWGAGSQAQVGPVQASILAHLPLTLRQLDVQEHIALRDTLSEVERAQRKREQVPLAELQDASDIERQALDRLSSLVQDPRHQRFIWGRVCELMERYGYRADSVLLELVQNADDALSQAADIAGAALPRSARRIVVRIGDQDGRPTIDLIHYGRPINDTGGPDFPAGVDRQWDQDLYFMMLLNLSGKPGEMPGQHGKASTTGRFGLGFKSVHLVSESPSLVSGFVAFSVAGGLLPLEQPMPAESSLAPADGHLATRVRLPLRTDEDSSELIKKLFRRFAKTRAIVPAFARQIQEIVVEGDPDAGVSEFNGVRIRNASAWSVTKTDVFLPGHGGWRLLRFRPADAGQGAGTAAIAIGLRGEVPEPFPSDLPFLWNVTPTSENWGYGYAVNGPFKLDPGRTHVSLDHTVTLRVANALGEALGQGLLELHDALVANEQGETAHNLPTGNRAVRFLATLWTVLASGLANSADDLRGRFLRCLHGSRRGISTWMSARSVVPSGLPDPFPSRLPPLTSQVTLEIASDELTSSELCAAFVRIDELASLSHAHLVVSEPVATILQRLLRKTFPRLSARDVLSELVERWNYSLTPERLHSLRPLAKGLAWQAIGADASAPPPWYAGLCAQSAAGSKVLLRRLLLPVEAFCGKGGTVPDNASEDEQRRAAFAPREWILDSAYVVRPEDQTIFLRLREHHEANAATVASWYGQVSVQEREAALRYLVNGELRNEVLARLVPQAGRPDWLNHYVHVREMLNKLDTEEWRVHQVLAALFPQHLGSNGPPPPHVLSTTVTCTFFERFQGWWTDPEVRSEVIRDYERRAWPTWLRQDLAKRLRDDSREHWLGLLVLGACRGLGRAGAGHHRKFVELIREKGWWNVFQTPDDTEAWMRILREWQDSAVGTLKYGPWMSLFPAVYQLSRYLETYRRLLRSAERPAEFYRVQYLLAPRVDDTLTGAGQNFDAPPAPLNMGLHWVLREIVRLGVIDGAHIYPDCWVPSEQVLGFLRPLGLKPVDPSMSNPDKARTVFEFLKLVLETETPNLDRAFDVPLRRVAEDIGLRRVLGLED